MEGVSVLIVTFNRAHLIAETITSVLNQSFQNFEIIIIDDGSTDNTEEIIHSFNDSRISYFKYPKIGRLTQLRNIAVSKSTKTFIAFIDSDDLWHSDKLAKSIEACITNNSSVCVADCIEFEGADFSKKSRGHFLNTFKHVDIKHEILINNIPLTYGTNIFLRKDVYTQIGGFDETLFHGDHDFLCRVLYGAKGVYLPLILSSIRRHDSNMSLNANNSDLSSLQEYNLTLKKLVDKVLISKKEFNKATANNHYLMARHALANSKFKLSFSNFMSAVTFNPQPKKIMTYFKKLLFS